MFGSPGQGKTRTQSSRHMNYRVECFADDDDSDSPYFECTDLSDTDFGGWTRSSPNNAESPRRDRPRRKTSRRSSQVPCAVEPDNLPLARPIPLQYDSDMFDTWCNRSRKPKRNLGGERYQENREGAKRDAVPKSKASPPAAPPPSPEMLARLISQSMLRHPAAAAPPSATTPRYYRRSTREASRRPSRLCLPITSQPDPALVGRRQSTHTSRNPPQPQAQAQTKGSEPRAPRHASKAVAEVNIPVQAHVSYVSRGGDDSPRGSEHLRRHPPRGEIRIPLDVFAAPFLATPGVAQWGRHLSKASVSRSHRSQSTAQTQPQRSHMTVQPVLVTPPTSETRPAPLRKRRSVIGPIGVKQRPAAQKSAQKHRAPSVRSRASDAILPQAVQSNLDALLTKYESQLPMPANRPASCTTQDAGGPSWGRRPDPRLIPVHLLKPRKPESVRQREFLARLEERIRTAAQSQPDNTQPAAPPSAQPTDQAARQVRSDQTGHAASASANTLNVPHASQTLTQAAAHAVSKAAAQQQERAAQSMAAQAAAPVQSGPGDVEATPTAESKLNSLLNDLMKSGFDVSNLEQKATGGAANVKPSSETKVEDKTSAVKESKVHLDPRGYYEALYNQQTLARADFSQQFKASNVPTGDALTPQVKRSVSRQDIRSKVEPGRRDWQSGDERRRPASKHASECANYASHDEESLYENQDFWDILDLNVDLNSVRSFSDGYDGHEDSYKYFRNGQVPYSTQPANTSTAMDPNVGGLVGDQSGSHDVPLQELWRHSERPTVRAQSKPVTHPSDSSPRPPPNGEYYHWPNYQGKSGNDGQAAERSREASSGRRDETRVPSTIAEPSTPANSHDLADGDGDVDVDVDGDTRRIHVSKSFIAEVVEETLDRRRKSCTRIASQAKMNVGQAIELIKRKSSSMNDALCMEIAKALSDRLIDCESARSEKEYVKQLKKLRSDHLRHISREVKRLQDLEGFLDDFSHVRTLYDTACSTRNNEADE